MSTTFQQQTGFGFLNTPNSTAQARYCQANEYDNMFQTTQTGNCTVSSALNVMVDRVVPAVDKSIFAGTRGT